MERKYSVNQKAAWLNCPFGKQYNQAIMPSCKGEDCALFCSDGDSGQCAFKKLAEAVDALKKIANVEVPFSEEPLDKPTEPCDEDEESIF